MRPETAAIDTLLETLNAERQVVEYLLFKVVTLNLLLAADERRWVEPATAEVDRVTERLRVAEEHRTRALSAVASDWGVPVERLSLARLAKDASPASARSFRELQVAFRTATDEIERVMGENRRLADSGLRNIQMLLDSVAGSDCVDVYTDSGLRQRAPAGPLRLDWAL